MADLETFRAQTRQWLQDNAPASIVGTASSELEGNWGGRKAVYKNPDAKVWLDRMAERGWTAPEWPTEYGGGGLSKAEAKVLREEMAALKLPVPLIGHPIKTMHLRLLLGQHPVSLRGTGADAKPSMQTPMQKCGLIG